MWTFAEDCYRAGVSTNEQLRKTAQALVTRGVTQKILAKEMGMSEAGFSRWVRGKASKPADADALDGLHKYIEGLRGDLSVEGRKNISDVDPTRHGSEASLSYDVKTRPAAPPQAVSPNPTPMTTEAGGPSDATFVVAASPRQIKLVAIHAPASDSVEDIARYLDQLALGTLHAAKVIRAGAHAFQTPAPRGAEPHTTAIRRAVNRPPAKKRRAR